MSEIKITRRVTILLLFLLILLNFILRYPSTPHQLGADGFFNNSMSKFIMEDGYANWILSPFSYIGLGPFSYPAAIHFCIASISQLGNIPTEESMLYMNMIIGICGVIFSFMMVRELFSPHRRKNEIALISSFFFSLSPEFLRLTNWNGSSRSMVMVFFLLLVFFLFKTQYAKRVESHSNYYEYKFTGLTILMLGIIMTMHRMWIFAVFIIIGYLIPRPIYMIKKIVSHRSGLLNKRKHYRISITLLALWILSIMLFIYIQLNNLFIYSGMNLWSKYQEGFLFSGSTMPILFTNMVIDYWTGWGIMSAFLIFGAFVLFTKRNKSFTEIFLLVSILSIAPIVTLGLYSKLILIVFITPLVAMGILWLITNKSLRRIVIPSLLFILIVSSAFNIFMINHWTNLASGGDYMTMGEYDVGMYVDHHLNVNDTYISNNQVFGNKVLSITDTKFLTETFQYPLVYGWVQKNEIESIVDWNAMLEQRSIEIIYPEEYTITIDHRQILQRDVDVSAYLRNIYGVNYVIENDYTLTAAYYIRDSISISRYLIFDNTQGRIWYIG